MKTTTKIAGGIFLAALFVLAPAAFASEITLIYSGETHAMIEPCDCPDDPGGGLAQRAGFLNGMFENGTLDRKNTLLLDGGGFSGGGIYDTYSAGRAADSARTVKTIAAMGMMGYDAVGIGDDDLQYGGAWLVSQANHAGVPLVCANCYDKDGKYLAAPYIIVKKGENTFGITSVVTTEKLFPTDTNVIIKDPLASLEKIRKELRRKSNYQILLSHVGEEELSELLKKSTGWLAAANGHRKVSVQPLVNIQRVPTLFFGFQGKSLSYAVFGWKNRALRLARSGWHSIDQNIKPDAAVKNALAPAPAEGKRQQGGAAAPAAVIDDANKVYDLYIMSLCPYGIKALGDLAELIRAFPQRVWNVWFIGTADGDKMSSLRGEEEMFDEKLWLGVKELYPFRYHEFLFLRSVSESPTEILLEEMGLDSRKVRRWAEDAGASKLRKHYLRSARLGVSASPTLFINNNEYKKPIGGGRLVREECRAANPVPPFCNDYPECFEDGDCLAKGKIGKCAKGEGDDSLARCEFRDDAVFTLTVLVADSAMDAPEASVIETVEELMAGAKVNVVKFSSDEGQRIMAKYSPDALPFFRFEKAAEKAYRFSAVSEMLKPMDNDDGYTFKDGAVRANYFPKRGEIPGLIELYADPLMPDIGKVINALLSNPDIAKRVALRPVIARDPSDSALLPQDRLRGEEALRWLVLAKMFPKKYHAYLSKYADAPLSSYWFNWLKPIGVNQKKFMRGIDANRSVLAPYWDGLSEVWLGEPVMILIGNRMKVAVAGELELERVLKSIKY